MTPTPADAGEWHEAIGAWPRARRRTAAVVGVLFAVLVASDLLLRLVAGPGPGAARAPRPAWHGAAFVDGDWMRQLDRHLKESSWVTFALRGLHDEALQRLGVLRPQGMLGRFHYQTSDGEILQPDQLGNAVQRGFVVPVPGTVGRELPRPRLMIAPGQSFWLCYHDNDVLRRDWFDAQDRVLVRLNALGLRERPEVVGDKPPGQRRVLCLGDSLTLGWGVPEELVWVRQLEQALRAGGLDVRTINAGAAGTVCVDEYWAALQHRFAGLQPDAVVVAICLNDLIPSSGLSVLYPDAASKSPVADVLAGRQPRGPLDLGPERDWVGELLRMSRADAEASGFCNADKPFDAMWSQGTPQAALRAMKAFCDGRDIALVVTLWPFLQGLGRDRHYPFQRLHELVAAQCAADGIPFVDLLPALRDVAQEELWVSPADMHPNPRAHRLVVPRLAAAVANATGW